jgi:hypothetical protein
MRRREFVDLSLARRIVRSTDLKAQGRSVQPLEMIAFGKPYDEDKLHEAILTVTD